MISRVQDVCRGAGIVPLLLLALACLPAAARADLATGPQTALGTTVNAVASEADGNVIAVGADGADVLVRRVAPDGGVIGSFDAGAGVATGVAIQHDGGIVVVGTGAPSGNDTLGQGFVRRFLPDGRPDVGFGAAGSVPLTALAPQAVVVAAGRRIVIGGFVTGADGFPRGGLVRLLPGGVADGTFGSGGSSRFDVGGNSRIDALAAQPDGRIVFAGRRAPGLQVTAAIVGRATLRGDLDPTFAGDGLREASQAAAYAAFDGVAVEPSGSVVAAGTELTPDGSRARFERFTPAGQLDPSFGDGGIARLSSTQNSSAPVGAQGVVLAGDGRLVAGGAFQDSGQRRAALYVLTSAGLPDPDAGPAGTLTTTASSADGTETNALAVTPAGDLVAAGRDTRFDGEPTGVVRRFGGFGPPPPSGLSDEVPVLPPLSRARRTSPARLAVTGGRVDGRSLRAIIHLTAAATGRLRVTYRANGASVRFTVAVRRGGRAIRLDRALGARLRRHGTGLLTLAYVGSTSVRGETTRLRVGHRSAALRVRSALIDSTRFLVVTGTTSTRATGTVLARLVYAAADGQPVTVDVPAKIGRGRWRVETPLPDAAVAAGGSLSIRYPGAAAHHVRGEQVSRALTGLAAP